MKAIQFTGKNQKEIEVFVSGETARAFTDKDGFNVQQDEDIWVVQNADWVCKDENGVFVIDNKNYNDYWAVSSDTM